MSRLEMKVNSLGTMPNDRERSAILPNLKKYFEEKCRKARISKIVSLGFLGINWLINFCFIRLNFF